ncbi:hypothetical protein AAVH_26383 [Aphelenchoides avenae]|nr:hypothetical protein AAVH_26383 [Aphelenchus avenae]
MSHLTIRDGLFVGSLHGFIPDLGFSAKYALGTFQTFVLFFTITGSSIPPLYRYFNICRNRELRLRELAALTAIALVFSAVANVAVFFSLEPVALNFVKAHPNWSAAYNCEDPHQYPFFTTDLTAVPDLSA